jgi:hypothetical protein
MRTTDLLRRLLCIVVLLSAPAAVDRAGARDASKPARAAAPAPSLAAEIAAAKLYIHWQRLKGTQLDIMQENAISAATGIPFAWSSPELPGSIDAAKSRLDEMGPATAPVLAAADQDNWIESFRAKAIPHLLRSACDERSPFREASYWKLRELFPLQAVPEKSTDELLRLADDSTSPYRALALGDLVGSGRQPERVAKMLLNSYGDDAFMNHAAMSLAYLRINEEQSIDWLQKSLEHRFRTAQAPYQVRCYVNALGAFALGNDQALKYLCRLLDHAPSSESGEAEWKAGRQASMLQCVVADELGRLGPRGVKAVPALGRMLRRREGGYWLDEDRKAAAIALGEIGGLESRETLQAAQEAGINEALLGLKRLGAEARPPIDDLLRQLQGGLGWEQELRICAMLHKYGPEAERAVPVLVDLLRNSKTISHTYLETLSQISREARRRGMRAVACRLEELDRSDEPMTPRAFGTLENFGADARPVIPWLIRQAAGGKDRLRGRAIEALCAIAIADEESREQIVAALQRPRDNVDDRAEAEEAVRKIRTAAHLAKQPKLPDAVDLPGKGAAPARVAELMEGLHSSRTYRDQAIVELGKLGPAAKAAVPALLVGLRNRYHDGLPAVAVAALARIAPDNPEFRRVLPQLERAPSRSVRRAVQEANRVIRGASQ